MKILKEEGIFSEPDYGFTEFEPVRRFDDNKPSVTVDNIILRFTNKSSNNYRKLAEKKLQVCLIKREYSPFENTFAVPGSFIDLKSGLETHEHLKGLYTHNGIFPLFVYLTIQGERLSPSCDFALPLCVHILSFGILVLYFWPLYFSIIVKF